TIGAHGGLAAGDTFLLCSDGLWHYFTDAELGAVTAKNAPRQASEMLINKAQERAQGKGDNCTMAIINLVKPPNEPPEYTTQKMGRAVCPRRPSAGWGRWPRAPSTHGPPGAPACAGETANQFSLAFSASALRFASFSAFFFASSSWRRSDSSFLRSKA